MPDGKRPTIRLSCSVMPRRKQVGEPGQPGHPGRGPGPGPTQACTSGQACGLPLGYCALRDPGRGTIARCKLVRHD